MKFKTIQKILKNEKVYSMKNQTLHQETRQEIREEVGLQETHQGMCTDNKVGGGLPTPVKEKVKRIEKTLLPVNPSPKGARKKRTRIHQPDPGQERIDKFFQKLAKAEAIKNKGVSNDPLLGVSGHSATLSTSKEGTGLVSEESGGSKGPAGKKRTIKVLER